MNRLTLTATLSSLFIAISMAMPVQAQSSAAQHQEMQKEMQAVMEKFRTRNEDSALDAANITGNQKKAALDLLKENRDARSKLMQQHFEAMRNLKEKMHNDLIGIVGKEKADKFVAALQESRHAGMRHGMMHRGEKSAPMPHSAH